MGCVALAFVILAAARVQAAIMPVTFLGSSPLYPSLTASARFEMEGGNLQLTLTNTSMADVMAPGDVLTAIFFDLNPATTLTRISAKLAPGSTVLFPPAGNPSGTDPNGVVGGEWAYASGLSDAPGNAGLGVSSSGLDWFGPGNRFPGSDLQGPPSGSPDGIQYGITSAGDDPTTGNQKVTGSQALIQNSVVFTFGVPTNFRLDTDILNVSFQYGTALCEPNIPGTPDTPPGPSDVPEPATLIVWSLLLGSAWLGLRVTRRGKPTPRRQPWSPENREAINEIIARGVSR